MATTGIHLFDADPDLLEQVPEEERELAARITVVPAVRIPFGAWDVETVGRPRWGLLILSGMLVREVEVAGSTAAELLGIGDIVLAGEARSDPVVSMEQAWTVLDPGTVALLDDRFAPTLRRWPAVGGCLLERAERRSDRHAMAQAISHVTRVDARVLMMLWLLGDRWGRVANQALVVPMRLTHRTLARLVGARRPSVTTAVTQLTERGLLSRRDDGSWVLHGAPPHELARAGIERLPARPAPGRRPLEPVAAPPMGDVRRRLALELPRLAAAYEEQRDRTRANAVRSQRARDSSRRLREARAAKGSF